MKKIALLAALITPFMAFAQSSPSTVDGVTATAGAGFVDLAWSEATPADGTIINGYNVYWSTEAVDEPGEEYENVVKVNFPSYTLRDLDPGTYFFAVTALCELPDCESDEWSPEVSATVESGTPVVEPEPEPVTMPPALTNAEHVSASTINLSFDMNVTVTPGAENFMLESRTTGEKVSIENTAVNGKQIVLTISEGALKAGDRYTVTANTSIKSTDGTAVESGNKNTIRFTAKQYQVEETPVEEEPTPEPVPMPIEEPEPVAAVVPQPQGLKVDLDRLSTEGIAVLSWTPAVGNNVTDQVLYVKENQADWEAGKFIGASASKAEITVSMDASYQMKIVSVDASGTESAAAEVSFGTPTGEAYVQPEMPEAIVAAPLPATGPNASLWGLLVIILGGMFAVRRQS